MKPTMKLEKGDVVQLRGDEAPEFKHCMMVVTEPRAWGAKGYVQMVRSDSAGGEVAYYRAAWEDMEFVGKATWVLP